MQNIEESRETTHDIAGSMTLREVEQRSGVPAAALVEELGLPANLPTDEKLGKLRRQYGFEMSDVRKAVERLQRQDKNKGSPK